ncbi:MAG TPA: hypothetical protein VM784_13240 [Actinomycetota bacterium]|nr:hypothetical protein [Actinomycetota bacterium]
MQIHRCTLDPAAMAARLRAFSEIVSGGAGVSEARPGGWRMTLDLEADAYEQLLALAAAEAECCPWMGLTVSRASDGKTVLEGAGAAPAIVVG